MRGERVQNHSVVSISYELLDGDGQLIEKRAESTFIVGLGQVLPALEEALRGQTKGFATEIHLSPERGYGVHKQELIVNVERQMFPPTLNLAPGMRFNTQGPQGEPLTVEVIKVEGERVILDGNHPLAGVALNFKIKLLSVRMASEDEVREQRVHNEPSTFH